MDPIFASIMLGFFSLVIALVAIAYKQNDVAKDAIKNSSISKPSDFSRGEGENSHHHSEE